MIIDPRWSAAFCIVSAILMFTAGASTDLSAIFNPATATKIVHGCVYFSGLLLAIGGALHLVPSSVPSTTAEAAKFAFGPNAAAAPATVTSPVTQAVAPLKVLAFFAVLLCSLAFALPTYAQPAKKGLAVTGDPLADIKTDLQGGTTAAPSIAGVPLTGNPSTDLATILTNLAAIPDAITLSTSITGLQDPVGNACWLQFGPLGELIKAHPLLVSGKAAADIEALRLAAIGLNQICANPNCGQMFVDASNAASAIGGNPLTSGLSLQSLCSKVPVIGTSAVPTAVAPSAGIGTTAAPAITAVPLTTTTPAAKP